MKKIKSFLLVSLCLAFALTALIGCTQNPTLDIDGNEVTIDFGNITSVEVLNAETIANEGFNLLDFELSDITVHIVMYGNTDSPKSVDIPLTDTMIKAESKAKLSVAGTHVIKCSYGSKYDFEFTLRLYTEEVSKYQVVFYDETGNTVIGVPSLFSAGDQIIPPEMPTKSGYEFIGWKDKSSTSNTIITDFTVTKSISYVAVYEPSAYDVNFYYTIGEKSILICTKTIKRGESALSYAPEIPIVAGYSNGRWSDESAMTSVGSGNTDFYAIYDSDKVLVTFSYYKYEEGVYYDEKISWNVDLETEGVTPPDDVERLSDYVFLYWAVERDEVEHKVTFPYKVIGEIKFTAKYASFADGSSSLTYERNADNTAYTVTGLKAGSDDETVVIPQTYFGLPVNDVKEGAFYQTTVKKFAVSATNPYFRAYDGVLYNEALSELIAYPVNADRTSFSISSNARTIRNYAFKGANKLESITLSAVLETVGKGAFSYCDALTAVALPEGVTVIEEETFMNSTALTAVTLGSSITDVKDRAFFGAKSLNAIVLPSSLVNLGENVFNGCIELSSITIENSPIFTISNGALYGYNEGGTNQYYYLYAYPSKFLGGNYAVEYTLSTYVRVVKSGAFSNSAIAGIYSTSENVVFEDYSVECPLLVSMRFSQGTITLNENTFGAYKPSKIYLSATTQLNDDLGIEQVQVSLVNSPYREFVDGFAYELDENKKATIIAYKGKESEVIIPETIKSNEVVAIKDGVFRNNLSIKKVTVASTVTEIGANAFRGCVNLQNVVFGDNLTKIGEYAFYGCSQDIVFDGTNAKLTAVGGYAFGENYDKNPEESGLVIVAGVVVNYVGYAKEVVIPEQVSIIAHGAFKNAPFVSNVDFTKANGLLSILDEAFYGLEELTSVAFPTSLERIGDKAFCACIRLVEIKDLPDDVASTAFDEVGTETSDCWVVANETVVKYNGKSATVVLPSGIKKVGKDAFSENDFIEKVVLSDGIVEIEETAFENCKNLAVFLPSKQLTTIGDKAFFGCENLTELSLGEAENLFSVASNAFDGTEWLNNYLEDSVIINKIYFKYLGSLDELHIPNSIEIINDRAFYQNTTLRILHIPESVRIIGEQAFAETDVERFNFALRNVAIEQIGVSAFENCDNLVSLDIRNLTKLTKIGERAFAGISAIEEKVLTVYIPSSVVEIGTEAFMGANVNTVKFEAGSGLTVIAERVFKDCQKLESVIFEGESELTTISESAFENCIELKLFNCLDCKLTKIEERAFAEGVKLVNFKIDDDDLIEVGKDAFLNNKFIKDSQDTMVFVGTVLVKYNGVLTETVYVPAKTTAIANSAFANNVYIEKVIFEQGANGYNVKEIQDGAFMGCISLKSIEIPVGVERIGANAFRGCVSLASVTFANTVVTVEYGAFADCESLVSVDLPNSITTIEGGAFENCEKLEEISIEYSDYYYSDGGVLYSYMSVNDGQSNVRTAVLTVYPNALTANNGIYDIPQTIRVRGVLHNVVGIGDYAFAYTQQTAISEIVVHSAIKTIGKMAFAGIQAEITFSANSTITELSDYSFADYYGTKINIPETVTRIGEYAFFGANNIDKIVIPSAVTVIGGYAFFDTDMEIEWDTNCQLKEIEDYAFVGYLGQEIIVPQTVKTLGKYAFDGITAKVEILADFEEIGEYAFYGYQGEYAPTIPSSVVKIGDYAFAEMTAITDVITLPNAVKSLGEYAFSGISVEVAFGDDADITQINEYAFAEYKGQSIEIPKSVKEIGNYAFFNCENLSSVVYEQGTVVSVIGKYAFSGNMLTEITIPDTVLTIKEYAYSSNADLQRVIFTENSLVVSIGIGAFSNDVSLKEITVPFVGESVDTEKNTHIGYIFGGKTYLENEAVLPSSLEKVTVNSGIVATNAFYGCNKLKTITVDESVTGIGDGAFNGCVSVEKLTIPYGGVFGYLFGADKYANNANYVPTSLKTVEIVGITAIVDYAFYNCRNIRDISLPDGLVSIGREAFYGCSGISTIKLDATVEEIGTNAFARCSSITAFNVRMGNAKYATYQGVLFEYEDQNYTAKLIAYPQKKAGDEYLIEFRIGSKDYDITEICGYAFYYAEITTAEVPDTVTKIGEYAFAFSKISSIRLRTADIGNSAFASGSIETVYVESSDLIVKGTDEYKLFTDAKTVYVEKSLEDTAMNPATYVYNNFERLYNENTQIYTNVTKYGIEYVTFVKPASSGGVSTVELNVRVISSDYGKVTVDGKDYPGITNYVEGTVVKLQAIPNKDYAFVGWFENDELISSNETIDYTIEDKNVSFTARFVYLDGEKTVWKIVEKGTINDGAISYYLVETSNGLDFVNQRILMFEGEGALNYIGEYYSSHKTSVTAIKIGSGITSINDGAFSDFSALKYVSISDTCTSIGANAFAQSALVKLTIPSSVTSVGENAFYGCTALKEIVIEEGVQEVLDGAFGNTIITAIEIPSTITNLSSKAFVECGILRNITVRRGNPKYFAIDGAVYAFDRDTYLASLYIVPNGQDGIFSISNELSAACEDYVVNEISDQAFVNCSAIYKVIIPAEITVIADGAFVGSSITEIEVSGDSFVVVDDVLYQYVSETEVKAIYNYSETATPSTVEINGKNYTVVNP